MIEIIRNSFMNNLSKIYSFDDFRFDGSRFALYHRDQLVKETDKKTMQVLAVLLLNPNKLTSHDEIIEQVWEDNPHGVTSGHIGQYISRLRKVFGRYAPEKKFIETVKGRGYSFVAEIFSAEAEFLPDFSFEPSEYFAAAPENKSRPEEESAYLPAVSRKALVFSALIFMVISGLLVWKWFPQNDEQEIRRVVEESQKYESLVLYKSPASVIETNFNRYWLSESEFDSELDIIRVRAGVERLRREGRYYGKETKCEQFEFQSLEINETNDFAVVKTLEKWFIAEYSTDGALIKNKTIGPYFVTYTLRKKNDRWLVEKSTTARAKPTPQ